MKYSEQTIKQFMSLGMERTKTLSRTEYCLNFEPSKQETQNAHTETQHESKPMGKALQSMNGE